MAGAKPDSWKNFVAPTVGFAALGLLVWGIVALTNNDTTPPELSKVPPETPPPTQTPATETGTTIKTDLRIEPEEPAPTESPVAPEETPAEPPPKITLEEPKLSPRQEFDLGNSITAPAMSELVASGVFEDQEFAEAIIMNGDGAIMGFKRLATEAIAAGAVLDPSHPLYNLVEAMKVGDTDAISRAAEHLSQDLNVYRPGVEAESLRLESGDRFELADDGSVSIYRGEERIAGFGADGAAMRYEGTDMINAGGGPITESRIEPAIQPGEVDLKNEIMLPAPRVSSVEDTMSIRMSGDTMIISEPAQEPQRIQLGEDGVAQVRIVKEDGTTVQVIDRGARGGPLSVEMNGVVQVGDRVTITGAGNYTIVN